MESTIGSHLLNFSRSKKFNVYYWRHRNDEIDFVIKKGEKIIGLEVKSGQKQYKKGMTAFKNAFPDSKLMMIGSSGLPWQEFLKMDPEDLF